MYFDDCFHSSVYLFLPDERSRYHCLDPNNCDLFLNLMVFLYKVHLLFITQSQMQSILRNFHSQPMPYLENFCVCLYTKYVLCINIYYFLIYYIDFQRRSDSTLQAVFYEDFFKESITKNENLYLIKEDNFFAIRKEQINLKFFGQ